MSEPLPRPLPPTVVAEPAPELPAGVGNDNDNEAAAPAREGERRWFEFPRSIWRTMLACYGVFLAALVAATARGVNARLMAVISAVYMTVLFGSVYVMMRQPNPQPASPLERPGGVLQTADGPLTFNEVAAQVLTVPIAFVVLGFVFLALRIVFVP